MRNTFSLPLQAKEIEIWLTIEKAKIANEQTTLSVFKVGGLCLMQDYMKISSKCLSCCAVENHVINF